MGVGSSQDDIGKKNLVPFFLSTNFVLFNFRKYCITSLLASTSTQTLGFVCRRAHSHKFLFNRYSTLRKEGLKFLTNRVFLFHCQFMEHT
jgi:hypothetical protein